MSLISDADYLIHHIRLSYLRDVEDPYGPRILSLDPSYQGNPYIAASGLADPERWRELAIPNSPDLSEDENGNASGFPGARLKHTQTIMGGKSGAYGMRVHGKRASTSKRLSQIQQAAQAAAAAAAAKNHELNTQKLAPGGASVLGAASASAPTLAISLANNDGAGDSWVKVGEDKEDKEKDKTKLDSPGPNVKIQEATAPEENPVAKVVQFVPKFTAETEARRRMRIAARRGPTAIPQAPPPPLTFDSSSEDEVEIQVHSDVSSDEFGDTGADSMDEGDEFDPEFAATRTEAVSGSAFSIFSATSSMPNSSAPDSATHAHYRARAAAKLSPVTEQHRHRATSRTRSERPPPDGTDVSRKPNPALPRSKSDTSHANSSSISSSMELSFAKKTPPQAKAHISALSSMLASTGNSSNPFTEMYGAISGRGESASTTVRVYFPRANRPAGKAMELNVRKDASVEEVIGYALWNYWEEGWLPKLDEGLGDDDTKREHMLSAVGWILRIAEDDGEVDDDFPPPDRMGKITKFNSDAYAILEASATQIQQNEILESKIQRRPSRTMASKKPERLNIPVLTAPSTASGSFMTGSHLGSLPLSTSLGPSFSHGPQIFLRIRVADTADPVHISTTIPVSAGMYMQEALEMVIRRRKMTNAKDYALLLVLPETTIMVPLDRTVASLQGNRELLLVNRNMLDKLGLNISKEIKTTDPNASIFKGMSDTPEQQYSSATDWTAAYKKYTIYRKMPMLVTRQERTLAIDGVYIHIMPSTNKAKAVFDHGKTSSYHIKSIADCQLQSPKSLAFKLVLNRGSGNKRYDFEADTPKTAAEIVATIRGLKAKLERSGTVNKSRRSRQVV
ncbi:hypothetical protein FA15DRAFT_671597 [Coprinopsis marcescibilis]|uniref:SIN1-domain-containing protein n=1 Tax=Coprinopsis marcescibilis TaxID=230819 RepID=A0A5C3KPV6_COPMA|nr:hypothetical protein FA15DRAFT_671597 [Coprinopsis marcescibilis]